MSGIPTFWVEMTGYRYRYERSAQGPCSVHGARHLAINPINVTVAEHKALRGAPPYPGGTDPYPASCDCGHRFTGQGFDARGIGEAVWRRLDNGQEIEGRLPVGACFEADPIKDPDGWTSLGADGKCIHVVVPRGEHGMYFCCDWRASNCTLPADSVHRCWVRHGTVGDRLTLDKNGNTCRAGAGSIVTSTWHGFLRDGMLVAC